jgi:hypothetical protein
MSIKARLDRLEQRRPEGGTIHWDNLAATRPEDIVPDGIVDWYDLCFGLPPIITDADHMNAQIAAVGIAETDVPTFIEQYLNQIMRKRRRQSTLKPTIAGRRS